MQSDCKDLMRARVNAPLGYLVMALALVGLLAVSARAQGVRYDNIVLGPSGRPVSSAQVAVCSAAAVRTTTPCSPLAQVYSDQALKQPMANPFTADSLGNYGFWAEPGHYVVQIYGTGVSTRTMDVFLACDPSNCSMTSATVSSITAGTLNLTGSLSVDGRNVATEPLPSDAVQYVSPNGSDSSDGLSWGTAKQSLYAAVSTLENAKGGTVYVAAGSSCGGPVSGQGLWLMGGGDPNYNSPPAGWIKAPNSLQIIGVGVGSTNGSGVQNSPEPVVTLTCGSAGNNPALWISGTGTGGFLKFTNLFFNSPGNNAVRLGIGSDGSRTDTVENEVTFDGDDFSVPNNGTAGPTIDIGANTFWIWFRNCGIDADNSATALSDAHQAVVINPTSSGVQSSGLIFFNNLLTNAGGIHFYGNSQTNAGSLYVNGYTYENGNDGSPAVWITPTTGGGASATYRINSVIVADSSVSPTYAVQVDDNAPPDVTVVSNVQGAHLDINGPMTLLGGESIYNGENVSESPVLENEQGTFLDGIWTRNINDNVKRFSLQDSPYQNLVSWTPNYSSAVGQPWANQTGGSLTAVAAPDGSNNAWATPASPSGGITFWQSNLNVAAGDYFIATAWVKSVNGGYASTGPVHVDTTAGCGSPSYLPGENGLGVFGARDKGTGWEFSYIVMKIGASNSACEINFALDADSTHPMEVFAPTLIHVPTGVMNDADALNLAMSLGSFPSLAKAGVYATMPNHPIAFGGSGDPYFATLDHTALTGDQTYDFPNQSGTVALVLSGTTGSIGGSALAAGACTTGTASVAGSTTSMAVTVSPAADPGSGFTWQGWISSAGTATVRVCNVSGSSATPGAEAYNVRVIQ